MRSMPATKLLSSEPKTRGVVDPLGPSHASEQNHVDGVLADLVRAFLDRRLRVDDRCVDRAG